jgi:hypothetical protein
MGCGNDAENSVKGRRFLPPSHGYVVIVGKSETLESNCLFIFDGAYHRFKVMRKRGMA